MTVSVFFKTPVSGAARRLAPAVSKIVRTALGRRIKGEVNVVFTDRAGIVDLNRRFLASRRVTDVIAFNYPRPAFAPRDGAGIPFGDIYICVPRAAEQADAMGHGLETELLILTAHGALHLAGMDDSTAGLRRKMNERTVRLLRGL